MKFNFQWSGNITRNLSEMVWKVKDLRCCWCSCVLCCFKINSEFEKIHFLKYFKIVLEEKFLSKITLLHAIVLQLVQHDALLFLPSLVEMLILQLLQLHSGQKSKFILSVDLWWKNWIEVLFLPVEHVLQLFAHYSMQQSILAPENRNHNFFLKKKNCLIILFHRSWDEMKIFEYLNIEI